MNVLVDIAILFIAGATVFLAGKRGFVLTAVNAASSLISLLMVFCFTGVISDLLAMTPLQDLLHTAGVKAVSMVLIFILTTMILRLFGKALTAVIKKLPFVRKANTLLGLLLGFFLALIRILLFCAAVSLLSASAGLMQIDFLTVDAGSTVLYRLFDGIQILKFLF